MNKFMHPKNPFRTKKPNFKKLADKYPYFAEVTEHKEGEENKVEINFKEPRSQYALSKVLMKEYFDLDLSLPLDRLIPTIPLRLNYLLWIKEILSSTYGNQKSIRGLDIGTGASCIYPLLGAKVLKWQFVCTEVDKTNLDYAVKNVENNFLSSNIQVMKVNESCVLSGALTELEDVRFDFVMSNPPFFASSDEAYGFTNTRDIDKRSLPVSASTASLVESVRHGGEVIFVCQLIHESLETRNQIKIYSSMLGKKQSLKPIKRLFSALNIPKWSVYEFCQGRVMRWGLAWSFDPAVVFPRSPFQMKKLQMRRPLTWVVPEDVRCLDVYDRAHLCEKLKQLFKELQIHCLEQKIKGNSEDKSLVITAFTNTWSKQRRKRREELQKKKNSATNDDDISPEDSPKKSTDIEMMTSPSKDSSDESKKNLSLSTLVKRKIAEEEHVIAVSSYDAESFEPKVKRARTESPQSSEPCSATTSLLHDESDFNDSDDSDDEGATSSPATPSHLVKARIFLRLTDEVLTLEMNWISGINREVMNQIFQFVKNHVK